MFQRFLSSRIANLFLQMLVDLCTKDEANKYLLRILNVSWQIETFTSRCRENIANIAWICLEQIKY